MRGGNFWHAPTCNHADLCAGLSTDDSQQREMGDTIRFGDILYTFVRHTMPLDACDANIGLGVPTTGLRTMLIMLIISLAGCHSHQISNTPHTSSSSRRVASVKPAGSSCACESSSSSSGSLCVRWGGLKQRRTHRSAHGWRVKTHANACGIRAFEWRWWSVSGCIHASCIAEPHSMWLLLW